MSWLKSSDASHSHPAVFQALEHPQADDRTVNELFGCMSRCAAYVAAFEGDYVIRLGPFKQIAGMSRWQLLADQAVSAGYANRVELEDGSEALRLVEDEELFHMIPRSARDWANQRNRDARNIALTVPVRLRDGDGCRWCGVIVNWRDRKSARGGTYDHLIPGKAATPETFVVACKTCNSARQDDLASWDKELYPIPSKPYYTAHSAAWLASHGEHVEATDGARKTRPRASAPDDGTGPAAHSATPPAPAVQTPEQRPDPAPEPPAEQAPEPDPADSGRSDQMSAIADLDLSGRDGAGRAGPGRDRPGQDGTEADLIPPPKESQHENPPTDRPRPEDHRPSKRKRPRRRKRK